MDRNDYNEGRESNAGEFTLAVNTGFGKHIMISADWPAVGQYVDFKDHEHVWGVGLVLFKNDHYIKIRNQGWGQRYDEAIPLTDDLFNTAHARIQPFRTIIRGYTGARKNPSPRDHWKYTREDHQGRLKKLQAFLANLKEKSKQELVQYLRGQHYFYVDFLMGNIYPTFEDLNKVYEYFTLHLQLLKDYLTNILSKGITKSYINMAVKRDNLTVWEETYQQCYYELVDAMYNIAGLQERLYSFFLKQNQELIKQIVGVYEKHEYYISTQVQNINIFQSIIQLIEQVYKGYSQCDNQNFKLPFAFHFSLFQLFQIIQPIFMLESLKVKGGELFNLLFKITSKAIDNLQPNDMKQVQIDRELEHILHYTRPTAARYNQQEVIGRWPQETRMQVCMLFLRCDKLEKKLRGISKVKEVAQRTIKEDLGCFGIEALGQMLTTLKVLDQLFVQNEHIQIYKKSTELVSILYKYDIVTVEELCFVWKNSIDKHPLIVSQLFQFWIEMAYVLQEEDIFRYAQTATLPISAFHKASSQYYMFFMDLVIAIVNNNVKTSGENKKDCALINDSIDTMLQQMISLAYQILISSKGQSYFSSLVSKYSTIVVESRFSQQLIQETYNRLIESDHLKVCLEILKEAYVTHDRIDVYVPEDIRMRLIEVLRSPQVSVSEVSTIFQILSVIISYSSKQSLTNKEFQILWEFFQGSKEQLRNLFYSWLLRTEEIHDNFTSHLNIGLTQQLKRFALTDIVSNQQYLNYVSLSKKQLSIILQLFIQVNVFQGKIQKKKLLEGYRFIHRIKSLDLLNQSTLWQIFEQCKSEEVIHYLIRYLIKFYFNFSPSLSVKLRKSRIDDIMDRIMTNIREGHKGTNTKLAKHSLLLLRGIFEVVKEDERCYYPTTDAPFTYKVKVQVRYINNLYRFDVGQNQTISYLKLKIAERLKLKPGFFKMLVKEDDSLEELDYTFKNVTVAALRKCQIEVVEIGKDEQTVARFVGSFINNDLGSSLVDMLENQMVASEVYLLIQELDLQLDKLNVLDKINTILQKYQGQGRTISNVQIYYHMLQLKLFYRILEKEDDAQSLPSSPSFIRMLRCMKCPVLSDYQVTFLFKVVSIIIKTIKKVGKSMPNIQLPEHLFAIIYELSKYLLKNKGVEHHIKEYAIKIIEQANSIIQHYICPSKIMDFYVNQPTFADFINSIFLHNEIQYIRMIFTDKLSRYLTPNPNQHFNPFSPEVQDYLLNLFIDNLYFKVKAKQLASSQDTDNESAYDFCIILAKIIAVVEPTRIDKTQIFQPIKDRSSSLFEECINFIESVRLFNSRDFHWNYLLCGHFYLLLACFQHRPSLLEPQLIDFVIQNCLALKGDISQPLCRKMEHINQAFKFINGLLIYSKDVKFIRQVIQALGSCHYLELWRSNVGWNMSPKHETKQAYRGLLNPGCICYMNSLLQQLFMIEDFRLALLDLETSQPPKIAEQKYSSEQEMDNRTPVAEEDTFSTEIAMLQGLKELFLKLQFSEENHINPTGFAKTLKTSDKKPMIKINQQMDIDEFASILFEKLQRGITQKNEDNFVNRLFGGVYSHQIISLECSHRSERQQQFFSMSLDVKDKITKSFESLVKAQLLDGGNKYHCQKCNKKVKAEKLQTIKQLPPYLILCLKRFQFDYDIDAKIKINQYCEFPHKLNLLPYSRQQILKNRGSMTDQHEEKQSLPEQHFNYKLRGVVVHTGSADSGHYYSFIDNGNGSWFEFNDEDVIPFDLDKLPEEAFGCKPSKYDIKTKNAYLLIYERVKKDQKKLQQSKVLNKQEHQVLIERIIKKNRNIRKSELVFSDEYEHLVRRLQVNLHHIGCPHDLQFPWYKFLLSFYFLVKARKQNLQYFLVFSQSIARQITMNQSFCSLVLLSFHSPRFIEEMFVFNLVRDKGKVLASVFTTALITYYQNVKPKSLEQNSLLFRVLYCLKSVFIVYGPVGELLTSLRKFFEMLTQRGDFDFLFKIIELFNFEQIIINSALNIGFEKKVRAECQKYCKSNINDVDFLAPLPFFGKKMHQMNMGQAWKICSMMLTLNHMYIQRPENQLKEQKMFYINNIQYLKRCFCDPKIETKMLSIIVESSSYKAIYYLYYTLKELDFSTKMFSIIQKALKDYESIKYRPFFIYLEHATNDKSLPSENQKKIVDLIERAYKINQTYFLETDCIHQWILRLASMSEAFLNQIESKTTFIQQICEKISRNPFPSITDLNKKFKHHTNQKFLNRYLGILVSTEIRQYEANSSLMKIDFEQIRNMTYSPTVQYMPPDQHFRVGDRIEYYDITHGRWKKAVIVEQHLGQLTIKKDLTDESRFQLWEDSQKIRKLPPSRLIEEEFTPLESDLSCSSDSNSYHH